VIHLATLTPFRRATLLLALATCMAASVAASAAAQDPQNSARAEQLKAQMIERFQQADVNKDGRITKAEANGKMPRLYQRFDQVDKDGDGYVNQSDIVGYVEKLAAQRR
jgi:Ca2+-binding EF-hand superfamily protein